MEQKSHPDIFFFYDTDWSHQGALRAQLKYTDCYSAAIEEIAKLEVILSSEESLLRVAAMKDYTLRALAIKRDDLLMPETMKDYHDYLFTTARPKLASIAMARDDLYGLVKKHNL